MPGTMGRSVLLLVQYKAISIFTLPLTAMGLRFAADMKLGKSQMIHWPFLSSLALEPNSGSLLAYEMNN